MARSSGWRRSGPGALAGLLVGAGALGAQRPGVTIHFPLKLAELSLAADSGSGLIMVLQPAATSKEGKSPQSVICLRFHPDSALEWINSAAFALQAPVPPGAPDGVQWSRPLNALNAKGGVTIGRERKKGILHKARWLAVADSASGWRLELTQKQADSLLQLVLQLGGLSRIDGGSDLLLPDTPGGGERWQESCRSIQRQKSP